MRPRQDLLILLLTVLYDGDPITKFRELVPKLSRFILAGAEAPATLRPVGHRPNPQKRPQRMQGEEADPAGGVDRILMRMIAGLGDQIGYVMNCYDRVENHDHNKYE